MLRTLALLAALAFTASAFAGASFNTNRDELDARSREAGDQLQQAVQLTHGIFRALEKKSNAGAAQQTQQAIDAFDGARRKYQGLVEQTPMQPLRLDPDTSESKQALEDLHRYCAMARLDFPKTERDLANVAVRIVENHIKVLSSMKFSGTPSDYGPIRALLRSESFVMEVGIVTSIVWTIAPPAK
jgi:hypothetical protein